MARYSEEIIDEIRQANDIVDVISQYVHLKRSGRNFFGLCPFHNEKSPSFSVSPDKQIFHCFGCGVGGNAITFVSKIEGTNFVETLKILAERANIQLPIIDNNVESKREELKERVYKVNEFAAEFYHQNLYQPQAKIGQEYVKKRQLSNETLKAYRIGFSGKFDELYKALKKENFQEQEILESGLVNKNDNGTYIDRFRNRLMFPICDVRGRVIAFGGRILNEEKTKNGKPIGKYINSAENIVYNKGRHLFGLNIAKKGDTKELLIVEGYMDVISLHQRGITNVVAPLGTALTEQQGWLLRRTSEKIIISFDSDDAGIKAKLRAIEILQKMGCDIRVIQLEGAKDPDEYIVKYGNIRFKNVIEKAMSVVEFKAKILQRDLNLENTSDKIKFLNEIAKIISTVDNKIEREIYIENISKQYNISKEAIYAEVNKLEYKKGKDEKVLEKNRPVISRRETQDRPVSSAVKKRENTIISILLSGDLSIFEIVKQNIKPKDFQDETNKKIAIKLYEEFEKGNSNINSIIDNLEQEEQNQITSIMAEDYEIEDVEKAIDDIMQSYERDKLNSKKLEILERLEQVQDDEEKKKLEKDLSEIIITLAKIK